MFEPEVVRASEHRLVLRLGKLATLMRAPITKIFRRWGTRDEYVVDSIGGTLTENGVLLGKIASVVLWLFRSDDDRHDVFSVKLLLEDGSKIEPVISSREKFVTQLANDIAAFLGKRVEIEYHGVTHGHPIRSLNLTEREMQDRK